MKQSAVWHDGTWQGLSAASSSVMTFALDPDLFVAVARGASSKVF